MSQYRPTECSLRAVLLFSLLVSGALVLMTSLASRVLVLTQAWPLPPETLDRLVWLAALVSVPICVGSIKLVYNAGRKPRAKLTTVVAVLTLIVLSLSVTSIVPVPGIPEELQTTWWLGFGPSVLIAMVPVGLALVLVQRSKSSLLPPTLWILSVVLAVVWITPSFLNFPWVYDTFHAPQVLNDALAFYAGRIPLADYIPQYTLVLGLPIGLVFPLLDDAFSPQHLTIILTTYVSSLGILSFALAVYVAYRVLPINLRALAPLMVLPLSIHVSGSLSSAPGRLLFPLILFALLLDVGARSGVRRCFVVGVVAGLAFLNNPEMGGVAIAAAFIALLVQHVPRRWRRIGIAMLGVGLPLALYALVAFLLERPVQVAQIAAYARAFTDGYYALPMPMIGTYLLILMTGVAAVTVGVFSARGERQLVASPASTAGIYAGVFTLGTFAYYVGRSSSSGQLQFLLPFTALAIVAIVGTVGLPCFGNENDEYSERPWRQASIGLVVLFLPAFAIAAAIQVPGLSKTWASLNPAPAVFADPLVEREAVRQLASLKATLPESNETLSVALNHSNLIALQTGMPSGLPYTAITDFRIGPAFKDMLCREIERNEGAFIIQAGMAEEIEAGCTNVSVSPVASSGLALASSRSR